MRFRKISRRDMLKGYTFRLEEAMSACGIEF
jgi:hypothetical protein